MEQTKLMLLIEPYLIDFPAGLYYVTEIENSDFYYINGMSHHNSRFVEPSSLLMELF